MSKAGVQRFAWIALTLGLGGCDKSPAALAQEAADLAELQAVSTASREFELELDALEARFYSGRATVRLWNELAERHQSVTQVACQNAQMHSAAMAAIERRDRDRAKRLRRNRVAESGRNLASDATVVGYDRKRPRTRPLEHERDTP